MRNSGRGRFACKFSINRKHMQVKEIIEKPALATHLGRQ